MVLDAVWPHGLLERGSSFDGLAQIFMSGVMQQPIDDGAKAFLVVLVVVIIIVLVFGDGGNDTPPPDTAPPGGGTPPGQPPPTDPSMAAAISLVGSETGRYRLEALTDVEKQLPSGLPANVVVELLGDLTDDQRLKGIRLLAGKIQRPVLLQDADRIVGDLTGPARREARRLLLS